MSKVWSLLRPLFSKGSLISFLQSIVFFTMLSLLIMTIWGTSLILVECSEFKLQGNIEGLLFFIKQFEDLYVLITGTLAIIGLYIAIERINLMVEANEIKANETWKKSFIEVLENIKINNPYMAVYFEQISDKIYRYLYKRNFVISNELMLKFFINRHFGKQIISFEKKSKVFLDNNEKYLNENQMCSFDEMKDIMAFIGRLSHEYDSLVVDFEKIYRVKIKTFVLSNLKSQKEEK